MSRDFFAEFLASLNPAQRDAVTAEIGPALVLAGAGSGKTRVLTGRAFYLIRELNVLPRSVAVMTFTNKAARELRERLGHLLEGSSELPWAGTFHSFCVQLLRQYGNRAGLAANFTIYDEDDSQRVVTELMRERFVAREGLTPRQVRGLFRALRTAVSAMDEALWQKPLKTSMRTISSACAPRMPLTLTICC
ncbi:MAG: UvrD-helicase domain-containing protein [bacterium]|nr:UvrD-helicase domain-containing protein [bacterium]